MEMLEAEKEYYKTEKEIALARLVRTFLDTNWVDSASYYLEQDGSIEAKCALVPIQIKHEANKAQSHIDEIRLEAERLKVIETPEQKKSESLENFCLFHETLISVKQREGSYYSLSKEELKRLEELSRNERLTVSGNAKAILWFLQEELPFEDVQLNLSKTKSLTPEKESDQDTNELSVYPNPASSTAVIDLGEENTGIIQVLSINGQLLITESVNTKLTEIDLSTLENGVYLVRAILADGKLKQTQLVVLK